MSKNILLKKASIKQLENEVSKRRIAKIKELETKKQEIENEISTLGNGAVGMVVETMHSNKSKTVKKSMSKKVASNEESLKDRLIRVAANHEVHTTTEFLNILENDGWKSTSAKPYYVVAAALASLEKKNVFRRINKGSYQLVNEQQ